MRRDKFINQTNFFFIDSIKWTILLTLETADLYDFNLEASFVELQIEHESN
jgi:hypothetical protein